MSSISCSDLSFTWPDGTVLLDHCNLALGHGRTGLIGDNGSGKSTLLRLIAGEVRPTAGAVDVDGVVATLPQHLTLHADRRVDDVLGIAAVRAALRALERGTVTDGVLDAIGDDWDVDDRARAILDRLGLGHVDLDGTVGALSGGESMLVGLAARFLRRPDVLLLDEPTNNLDLDARRRLYRAIDDYRGVLVVVSHDRALLDRMDRIAELRDGTVRVTGGNLTAHETAVAAEQEAARRRVRAADAAVRREQRDMAAAQVTVDRRRRVGRRQQLERRVPKILAQKRKRQAQVSAGRLRDVQRERLAAAEEQLAAAADAVRDDHAIRVELPDTEVPSRRTVLSCVRVNVSLRDADDGASGSTAHTAMWGRAVDLALRGPERVALLGGNGSGKTTLLRVIAGALAPTTGDVTVGVAGVGWLPQRLDVLDDRCSVLDNVRRSAPSATVNELRARLAQLHFRGDRADQPAGTLSGGERFRAVLATLLCAQPPPQLLLLDEPTNNLDLRSVEQLAEALDTYRGALIVASHDVPFLHTIGVTRWLSLDRLDGLTETDPP